MSPSVPSLKIDRLKKIINLINSNKRISLLQLEKTLAVPRITIQRDLVELENRRLIKRFHGGAMSLEYPEKLYDRDLKKSVNVAGKKKIAEKAVRLITSGAYIGLDSSSTVYYLSETIFAGNVLVLTCCIDSFKNFSYRDDIQVVLAGGRMNKNTNTLSGSETVDMIRKFHFDIVFISAESCIPEIGFFDPHEKEVQVKRALIESSNKTVMLIESKKIMPKNGIKVCDMEEIDYVITDFPAKTGLKSIFSDRLI
jgi:DeoR family fructose operon transcriptional repressor